MIKKSLLVGRGIYRDEVTNLIWDEYPDLREYIAGEKLLGVIYNLTRIMGLSDSQLKEVIYRAELEPGSDEEIIYKSL